MAAVIKPNVSRGFVRKNVWLYAMLERVLSYSWDMEKVLRIIARVLRIRSKGVVEGDISKEEMQHAEKLMLVHAMWETRAALDRGDLVRLVPQLQEGVVVTTGRVGEEALQEVLGKAALPILMPSSKAAKLYMRRAHMGEGGLDHRAGSGTLAQSRVNAWIVRGGNLARSVAKSCPRCRLEEKKLRAQRMGQLPRTSTTPGPPFTAVALDYAGPFRVRGEVSKRVTMKTWVLLYGCLATKALVLLLTSGYDTDSFLLRHEEFVSRHGNPATIYSDRGTNLVGAGGILGSSGEEAWDWAKIVSRNKASNWTFAPVGCQWRNGFIERMVAITKSSLKRALEVGKTPTYGEMVTVLARVALAINSRPLGVSNPGDMAEEMSPITPNMLLIGRSNGDPSSLLDLCDNLPRRCQFVKDLLDAWWEKWTDQVFPHLLPYPKWYTRASNLKVGDICQLYFPGQMVAEYKLVRVLDVHPDKRGLVRSVTIGYRPRRAREKPTACNTKLVKETLGVQRLCLVLPVEEQGRLVEVNEVDDPAHKVAPNGQVETDDLGPRQRRTGPSSDSPNLKQQSI